MTLDDFLEQSTWDTLKQVGSEHYKTGGTEPVDLYKSTGINTLAVWALTGAIRRARRNLQAIEKQEPVNSKDIKKVIHELLFLYVGMRK